MMEHNASDSPAVSTPPLQGFGTAAPPLALSASAAAELRRLLAQEPAGTVFRISVLGGGCSGFQYEYGFATSVQTDGEDADLLHEIDGVPVVTDAASVPFLVGATLDYVESLGGSSFEMKNPNTASSCGCGNSFTVK